MSVGVTVIFCVGVLEVAVPASGLGVPVGEGDMGVPVVFGLGVLVFTAAAAVAVR